MTRGIFAKPPKTSQKAEFRLRKKIEKKVEKKLAPPRIYLCLVLDKILQSFLLLLGRLPNATVRF